ncbi:peroxiredoxin-like family protein [Yeosuana sp. AK3]
MKRIFIFCLLISTLNSFKSQVNAQTLTEPTVDYASLGMKDTYIPKGLNVGEDAPKVTFLTSENNKETLASYYQKQPVVIIFYRGYWCPVCNKHLSEFAEKAKQIEEAGATLIAISSESYENVEKTKEQTGAAFTIVSDADGSIMKAFDVSYHVTDSYQDMIQARLKASIKETNANKEADLPVPATFIIDKKGTIVYKQFNPNYKVRASVEDILKNLPK